MALLRMTNMGRDGSFIFRVSGEVIEDPREDEEEYDNYEYEDEKKPAKGEASPYSLNQRVHP